MHRIISWSCWSLLGWGIREEVLQKEEISSIGGKESFLSQLITGFYSHSRWLSLALLNDQLVKEVKLHTTSRRKIHSILPRGRTPKEPHSLSYRNKLRIAIKRETTSYCKERHLSSPCFHPLSLPSEGQAHLHSYRFGSFCTIFKPASFLKKAESPHLCSIASEWSHCLWQPSGSWLGLSLNDRCWLVAGKTTELAPTQLTRAFSGSSPPYTS